MHGALTFLNGALHWLMRHKLDSKRVASVDLATEKYNEFPCPPVNPDRNTNLILHLLGGLAISLAKSFVLIVVINF